MHPPSEPAAAPDPRDEPAAATPVVAPGPPPLPPPSGGARTSRMTLGRLGAIGVAVAAGAAVTLMLMAARSAARSEAVSPAAPPTTAARPSVPAMSAGAPQWTSANQSRWVGNSRKSVAFEVDAERPVGVWLKRVTPVLVVRCMDRRTDVFVYTDSAAQIETEDENHTVRVALDDGPEAVQRWPDSVEHDALFAPEGPALRQALERANTLSFGFLPHNAGPVTARFDVRGLAQRLASAGARCD
jgi:hypothetical protein